MSQKSRIVGVKVTGQVFLGVDAAGEPMWSADPSRVLLWLSDGWRTRFNQHRSKRRKYAYGYGDQAGADPLGRVLVPIGSRVINISDREARERYPHLSALPAMLLQSPAKVENTEWFAAAKRRKTLMGKGRRGGRMPRFQSRKHSDARFVVWFNGGGNATYLRTGKRTGILTIRGQNPMSAPDGTRRWQVRFRVRHTQPVLEYTSVHVNLTRGEVVLTSPPKPRPHVFNGETTGVDVGVANTVATEEGQFLSLPDLKPLAAKVKRHQRRMAKARIIGAREGRDGRTSSRYKTHKQAAAAASAKAAHVREDWAHKTANLLVDRFDVIGIEDLKISNMTRRGRGKRGLNRSMLNAGLGRLRSFIEYKGGAAGVAVVAVNPKNTSRRCRSCGHVAKENRESQAVFSCQSCGYQAHADTNAAGNIMDAALAKLLEQSNGA